MDPDLEYDVMHSRWRVGRFGATNRSIFALDERKSPPLSRAFIGRMETIDLAEAVVVEHNQALAEENAYLARPTDNFSSLRGLRVGPGGIRVGEEVKVVVTDRPKGVLDGPIPTLFGMSHLKICRDGHTRRRGLLDA